MLIIRQENTDDLSAIRHVNEQAFAGPQEATLVDALRKVARPFVSLVAVEGEQIVGHICFSPVTVQSRGRIPQAMGLAPMAVLPEYQRRGIGTQLVRAGLVECQRLGCEIVVVLGHSEYYPRFGFRPAGEKGLRSEYEAPEEAFMVVELKLGVLDGAKGVVKYDEAFSSI